MAVLTELTRFAGLDLSETQIERATQPINASRRYSFTNDKALIDIYQRKKADLLFARCGYANIIREFNL